MVELQSKTLEYHCLDDGSCHCDWRLTIQDCVEENAARIVYLVNIAISALVFVIGVALLIHRIFIKGHRLFDVGSAKGCLRPKPIDCMLLLLMIFNILRLLTSVILITDISTDMVSRSFIFEFPWQFGYGAFALYLIGIAQTLADSHKAISSGWLPSPRTVDIIGSTFFLAPFIINNVCSLITGALARSNVYVAEVFVRILYVFWFVHCFSLSLAVLLSGMRLIRILNRHLAKFQSTGPRYNSVKMGIFKIRSVMGIIAVCLMLFAIFLLMYGALRDQIMINLPGSIFLCVIWNLLGPATTLCVEAAIIFNPNFTKDASLGLKSSSNGKGTMPEETLSSSFTGPSGVDTSFPGTLSQHAFEELKLQQQQYQQVFQKHNNHRYQQSFSAATQARASAEKIEHSDVALDDLQGYGRDTNPAHQQMSKRSENATTRDD